MFNSRSIQGILVLVVGTFLAIWLGLSIVTNQIETILQMVMAAALIGCISLGRKIWLLVPFMAALGISLRIPGQPSSLLLGQALVLGFATLLLLMRKLPFHLAWTEIEFWILILGILVLQVYMRNPVGVNLFGGDTVGGKGYALFAISLACTLLFCGLRVPVEELRWFLRLSIVGGMLSMVITILGTWVPAIGYYTGGSYTRTNETNYEDMNVVIDPGASTRVGYMLGIGNNLSLWIASFISPLSACLRPLWALLVLIALAAATLSGFRNGIITVGLTFLVGIAYRSGFSGLAVSVFGSLGALTLLAVVNLMHPLPPNVQRSLTFLPGTWEARYKEDAQGSSEWRFEMWREVLLTERWIQNKWIGDGLGFSAVELAAQMNSRKGVRAGISGFNAERESVLSNGDYHSGPVSTIRVIGYIGLILFVLAQIRLAIHAHRQIMRCRGTEWFPLALFIGIPLIWGPLFFIVVFGDFKVNISSFLLTCGMVRLLENNLPLPAYVTGRREAYVLRDRQMLADFPASSR